MTTKENLDNIYYDYAKQQDFEVCILTKDEEKTLSSKWVKYSQLCFEDDPKNDFKISKVNNRSILNNEIVIDLENPELYSGCIDSLERDGLYYTCYKTGSKGYHFHLLFNKELTTKEKETMIAKYGGDMQKAISRCMIALENCPHWKTGIAKTMVVNKKGTNNYGKYFDVALKMPVEAITSPTIEDSKKTIITLMSKFSPVPYAQMLFQNTEFIYDRRKQFWRYDSSEGIWRTDAEQFIRTELRKTLMGDEQQKKSYTDEVVSYIKDLSYKENFEFKKNPYIIAFKNVLFDLEKDTIISFAPSHYITNKLDIEFGKTTECPEIDKFFVDCLDNEHKEILYDIAAYTLFTDYPYQKLFFIYGPPCTGKSQYLKLLETFIGKQNCSMVEPRAIQTDKHSMYKMWLKLANIVSDINYDEFENVNQIKKLTGGDSVDIRPMYQEASVKLSSLNKYIQQINYQQ